MAQLFTFTARVYRTFGSLKPLFSVSYSFSPTKVCDEGIFAEDPCSIFPDIPYGDIRNSLVSLAKRTYGPKDSYSVIFATE